MDINITRNDQAFLNIISNDADKISKKYYEIFCDHTGKIAHAEDQMYFLEILQSNPENVNAFLSELFIWINKFNFTLEKYEEFKAELFQLEKELEISLFEIKTVQRKITDNFGIVSATFEDIVPKEITDPRIGYIIFNYIDNFWESDFFNVQLPRFLDIVNLYPK
jgi:hypothetical protein